METENPIEEIEKDVEKKSKKTTWVTVGIIIGVIILAYFLINKPKTETPEAVAKCIGEKSTLYVRTGCSHCRTQENMFGDNLKYLNIIDCLYEKDKCIEKEITNVPAWIINGEKIEGVQPIDKLRKLTGCK